MGIVGIYFCLWISEAHTSPQIFSPRGSNKNTIVFPVDLDESKGPIVLGHISQRERRNNQCAAGRR